VCGGVRRKKGNGRIVPAPSFLYVNGTLLRVHAGAASARFVPYERSLGEYSGYCCRRDVGFCALIGGADLIAACQQTLEQPPGLRVAGLQDVIVDKPEAAGQKSAFTWRQAVDGILAFIA
jgi:hypothetical protein